MMKPVDYKALYDELRTRLLHRPETAAGDHQDIKDRIRCRLALLLDAAPDTPLEVVLDRLDEKWRQDGLI